MSDGSTEVMIPCLTNEEDSFCLAVIEYGGNLGAASRSVWPDVTHPIARARELLSRPEIAKRVQQLSAAVDEHSGISIGAHLTQLAHIRDLAIGQNQLKVALGAELARGQVAGFHSPKLPTKQPGDLEDGKAAVQIFIGASPANIQEWGKQHGKAPVIIEMEK